jgi:hypothetical protein
MRSEGRTSAQFLGVTQPVPSQSRVYGFVIKDLALRGSIANHRWRQFTAFVVLLIVPLFDSLTTRLFLDTRHSSVEGIQSSFIPALRKLRSDYNSNTKSRDFVTSYDLHCDTLKRRNNRDLEVSRWGRYNGQRHAFPPDAGPALDFDSHMFRRSALLHSYRLGISASVADIASAAPIRCCRWTIAFFFRLCRDLGVNGRFCTVCRMDQRKTSRSSIE